VPFYYWLSRTAIGLPVRLLPPPPNAQGQPVPQLNPLVVRVACPGDCASPILYLDSQQIAWDQLGPLLDKKLRHRPPDWPVYVRRDEGLQWGPVVRAIDIIRGKQAQVVLLTARVAAP
jgi:hypothetical protein